MVTPFPDRDYPIVIGIDFGKLFFFLRFELNKRADFFFFFQVPRTVEVPMVI